MIGLSDAILIALGVCIFSLWLSLIRADRDKEEALLREDRRYWGVEDAPSTRMSGHDAEASSQLAKVE